MKDKVNKIKGREPFRSLAPIVMEEHAAEYFVVPTARIPYMQFVVDCKRPADIPAVCHVDNTSRVQTLTAIDNSNLHHLLEKFFDSIGCPLLLNTSLNVKGEPLVNTWLEAQRFETLHGVRVF